MKKKEEKRKEKHTKRYLNVLLLLLLYFLVSQSPQGLAKMMEVTVEVCRAFALTVSAKKTETITTTRGS